jgi:hypothetical protein
LKKFAENWRVKMPKDLFEEHGIDLLEGVPEQQEQEGLLQSLGHGYKNYAKGVLHGAGQAIGDIGSSAINYPISLAERVSGNQLPHVPHPNLINKNPESFGESLGQTLGQAFGGLAVPGGAALKGAQLAEKGYQALRAGRELPALGKMIGAGLGGAAEGYLGNEENRPLGAKIGAALGAGGQGIASGLNFAKSLKSKNIAKSITDEMNRLKGHFGEVFSSHLHEGEQAGANRFLKHQPVNQSLFKKAGESKQLHALEEYNANPTLSNAHEAQSDLNKLLSKYAFKKENKVDRDIYKEALKTKNRLLQQISDAFEKSGRSSHGAGYQNARIDYANELGPYLNSPSIKALTGRGNRGISTLRPNKFADKLLQEEEFLTQSGSKHPELLAREKYNKLKGSKLAHGVALGAAGGLAANFLPHHIRKILGF